MGIARKSLIDYFAQNVGMVVTFVAGILLYKFLGLRHAGEYSLVLLANLMLVLFTNFGIEISTRVFAGKEPQKTAQIHTASVLLILAISVFVALGLFFSQDVLCHYYFKGVSKNFLLIAALLLPFSLYQIVWQGIMVGLGEITLFSRIYMWNRIVQGGIVIILIAFTYPTLEIFIYIWAILQVVTFFVSFVYMAAKYRLFALFPLSLINDLLKFGWVVFVGNFASNLIYKYNFLIISNLLGTEGVGLYSRASTFSDKITLISGSLERATYQPAASADKDYAPFLIQKVFRYNLYINILGAIAMYILGSACIHIFLEEYLASLFPLIFLLLSVVFMSCSRILAVYFTAHLKKPLIPGIINWSILPVSLALCYVLTKYWGLRGASIAIALIYFLHALIFLIVFMIRNPRLKLPGFFLFKIEDIRNVRSLLFKS